METERVGTDSIRCSRLRWKALYVDTAPDPTAPPQCDGPFWCNRTQTCLGPDGRVVDDVECEAARECFEAV